MQTTSTTARITTTDMLTFTCRKTLQALRSGPERLASVARDVRLTLVERGLVAEHTRGLLELTARGRGVDPASFEA